MANPNSKCQQEKQSPGRLIIKHIKSNRSLQIWLLGFAAIVVIALLLSVLKSAPSIQSDIFQTLATVGATLAGFVGLILVFGFNATQRALDRVNRRIEKTGDRDGHLEANAKTIRNRQLQLTFHVQLTFASFVFEIAFAIVGMMLAPKNCGVFTLSLFLLSLGALLAGSYVLSRILVSAAIIASTW